VSAWRALVGMEIRRQLRQPAALVLLVFLPLLLGPGALLAGSRWTGATEEATQGSQTDPPVLRIAATAPFTDWVLDSDRLEIVPEGRVTTDADLGDDEVWARVRVEGRTIHLERDQQLAKARQVRRRVQQVARRHLGEERDLALQAIGIEPSTTTWEVVRTSHDGSATRGGRELGKMLPPLLLFSLLLGAVYTAFDVVTGDKERKTSETLLSTAMPRAHILAAKASIVLGSTVLAGTSWVVAVVVAHRLGLFSGDEALLTSLQALTPGNLVLVEGLVVLLGVQVAGAAIGVAAWVDDYRSGSMVAGPALLGIMAPSALPMLDGLDLTWWVALIPVGNVAMAFREVLAGQLGVGMGAAVLVVASAQAAATFWIGVRLLEREATFTGSADADARRAMGRYGPDALLTFVLVMLVFWFLGTLAQRVDLVSGHVLSQTLFAGAAFGSVAFFGAPWKSMRLAAPRPIDASLAVGVGLFTPIAAGTLFALQELLFPGTMAFAEHFGDLLGGAVSSVPLMLLLFALLPGLSEELLFRGALLGLLDKSLAQAPRVLLVAVLFGLMHLSVVRLLPTTLLGVVAGVVVLRSRSLWCGVLFHATHNATSLLLSRGEAPEAAGVDAAQGAAAVACAAVAVGLVALVGRGRRQ